MESLLWEEKLDRIKAYWTDISAVRRGSMVVMTVFFNTHIRKSVLRSLFPIAGCNPVAIIKWGGGK